MSDVAAWIKGLSGVTFPLWIQYLTVGWQVLIALMGGAVLGLTIYNKWLQNKKLRRELDDEFRADSGAESEK